jgi:hypothetical protein
MTLAQPTVARRLTLRLTRLTLGFVLLTSELTPSTTWLTLTRKTMVLVSTCVQARVRHGNDLVLTYVTTDALTYNLRAAVIQAVNLVAVTVTASNIHVGCLYSAINFALLRGS